MKKTVLSFGLLFIITMRADLHPGRSEAQPNRPLGIIEYCLKDMYDFVGLDRIGYHAVSQENEQFIRAIITELEMDDYCIEIRGMTYYAKCEAGYINAFVMPSIFYKKRHAYLYISEMWFDTLSQEEKRALVGHELMHIKRNHITKQFLVNIATIMSTWSLKNYVTKRNPEKFLLLPILSLLQLPGCLFIMQKYSRICEKDADIAAAQDMNNKDGMLTLLRTVKTQATDPKSKFNIKRLKDKILKPITHLLSSHPRINQRIKYIEKL